MTTADRDIYCPVDFWLLQFQLHMFMFCFLCDGLCHDFQLCFVPVWFLVMVVLTCLRSPHPVSDLTSLIAHTAAMCFIYFCVYKHLCLLLCLSLRQLPVCRVPVFFLLLLLFLHCAFCLKPFGFALNWHHGFNPHLSWFCSSKSLRTLLLFLQGVHIGSNVFLMFLPFGFDSSSSDQKVTNQISGMGNISAKDVAR